MAERCDVVVIGGGFFGLYLAEFLAGRFAHVVLCEREADWMTRASAVNQARVHGGYHYPRSLLTAARSQVNYPRFIAEFRACIEDQFTALYAVSRRYSKVTADQFRTVMRRVGAYAEPAAPADRRLFDTAAVEDVFVVREGVFNADALRQTMAARVAAAGVDLRPATRVCRVQAAGDGITVETDCPGDGPLTAAHVFSCTYAGTNDLLRAADQPIVPLKHELTEMALVEPPAELRDRGVTVVCGPFFSCIPYPPRGLHTLSHVRYTPHGQWMGSGHGDLPSRSDLGREPTAFPHMVRDAQRFVPAIAGCRYRGSLWEVKTLLPRNEVDDGRPILFLPHHGLRNFHVVLGGKIDNIYDIVDKIGAVFKGAVRG